MLFVALVAGCGAPPEGAPEVIPPIAAPAPPTAAPPTAAAERTGKVLEVQHGGGYTYARLDACGEEAWAAGPSTELTVGSTVTMPEGLVMTNFHAPSLGRTFDAILFVDYFHPAANAPACPTAAPAEAPPPAGGAVVGKVVETMDAGGYTYVSLDTCGARQWVAGPRTPVAVGEVVSVSAGLVLPNFRSPSLGRSFDSLRMVDRIATGAAPPACP